MAFLHRARRVVVGAFLAAAMFPASGARAQDSAADDGTDPTKLSRSLQVSVEHLDLVSGTGINTALLRYNTPISRDGQTGLQITLRAVAPEVIGSVDFGLGDGSVKLTRVLGVNRSFGTVLSGEIVLDTADSPFRGSGQTVGKLQFTYARFLPDGAIFGPTIAHTEGLNGPDDLPLASSTVIDLYYVPRLKDPSLYMTIDPSLLHDWNTDDTYGGLAVTLGKTLGKMGQASQQVFVKPAVFAGGERATNWGIEVGYKLIGF